MNSLPPDPDHPPIPPDSSAQAVAIPEAWAKGCGPIDHDFFEHYLDTSVDGLDQFELGEKGVYWLKRNKDDIEKVLICGPLIAFTKLRNLADQDRCGLVLAFIDQSQKQRTLPLLSRGSLRQPSWILKTLYEMDFYINKEYENKVILYLSKMSPKKSVDYVTSTGWSLRNESFVLPRNIKFFELCHDSNKRTLSRGKEQLVMITEDEHDPLMKSFRAQGSFKDWLEHVATPCKGNPLALFVLAAAFTGPLLRVMNMDSFCVHLHGRTTRGKTTTQQIAASVWGVGADPSRQPGDSFITRWNTTENAIGRQASIVNDTLLVLDEIGNYVGDDFGRSIYSFLSGTSRAGLTGNLKLRQAHHWRVVVLSSGEKSGVSMIERRHVAMGGQLNRFLDVPCGDNLFPQTGNKSAAKFADSMKSQCSTYYGTAGPRFVSLLLKFTKSDQDLIEKVTPWFLDSQKNIKRYLKSKKPLSAEQQRALSRFALILTAGEIAIGGKCLPFSLDEIQDAVGYAAAAWFRQVDLMSDGERMLESIRGYLFRHQNQFVKLTKSTQNVALPTQVIGYHDTQHHLFLLTEATFSQACGKYEKNSVREELLAQGYLKIGKPEGEDRTKRRYKIRYQVPTVEGMCKVPLYSIKSSILQEKEEMPAETS